MTNQFSNNDLYLKSTGPITSNNPVAGVGYATGAGAANAGVARTGTTAISNTLTGSITLAAGAGSATPATITLTNTAIAATDVIVVNQKSGSNLYETFVTAVGTGTFNLTFFTTGGTTSDSPVFNFAVIKGVTS